MVAKFVAARGKTIVHESCPIRPVCIRTSHDHDQDVHLNKFVNSQVVPHPAILLVSLDQSCQEVFTTTPLVVNEKFVRFATFDPFETEAEMNSNMHCFEKF